MALAYVFWRDLLNSHRYSPPFYLAFAFFPCTGLSSALCSSTADSTRSSHFSASISPGDRLLPYDSFTDHSTEKRQVGRHYRWKLLSVACFHTLLRRIRPKNPALIPPYSPKVFRIWTAAVIATFSSLEERPLVSTFYSPHEPGIEPNLHLPRAPLF